MFSCTGQRLLSAIFVVKSTLWATIAVSLLNPWTIYYSYLNGPDKERYRKKLLSWHGNSNASPDVLDPYNFSEEKWINDSTWWPSLEYPSIYAYLIDTSGEFTREKLKAFKSLEA